MASTYTTLCHSHGGATAAPFLFSEEEHIPSPPPPTPSNHSLSTGETDAFLSQLLTRLSLPPPTLLPLRPKRKTLIPPLISLREPNKQLLLSAATELGVFHLSDHDIPLHLHETYLQNYKSNILASDGAHTHMFETEFAKELKRVGLKILEFLFEERRGFETETRCLMCVSLNKMEENWMEKGNKEHISSCIVGLTYEGRGRKQPIESAVVDDSGEWVPVEAREEAVLITIGKAAEVWSNGRFKNVRSLPRLPPSSLNQSKELGNVLVTLLITLPEGGTISPLTPTNQDANIGS